MDMQIDFLARGVSSDAEPVLREFALRRLSFAVRRFTGRIRRVLVRLVDVIGPRRGVDSQSTITADLVDGGQLFVEATAASPFAALTLAAGRLSEALRRDTSRRKAERGSAGTASPREPEEYEWLAARE